MFAPVPATDPTAPIAGAAVWKNDPRLASASINLLYAALSKSASPAKSGLSPPGCSPGVIVFGEVVPPKTVPPEAPAPPLESEAMIELRSAFGTPADCPVAALKAVG